MRLRIEDWAEDNLSYDGLDLINEAIICYRVQAYRSAFLMSYLAFKQTIRERILYSVCPNEYNEQEWKVEIINKLKDEEKWDERINEIVKTGVQKKEGKIFVFSNYDRIKNRYTYWKDIRNACAHAKKQKIDASTVESFWNYMQDDMSEFYVSGSRRYLKNELMDTYKYYTSESDLHIEKLIIDVKNVFGQDVNIFFAELLDDIKKISIRLIDNDNRGFWRKIIYSEVQEAFIDALLKKRNEILNFYMYFDNILELLLRHDNRFIHDYINPLLCMEIGNSRALNKVFWKVLLFGLRNNEKAIKLEKITSCEDNFLRISNINIEAHEVSMLNQYNVFKMFILSSGKEFFENSSNSQWKYYGYYTKISDSDMSKYFGLVKWDKDLIDRIEIGIEENIDNQKMRTNPDSIYNAKIRCNCYKTIVTENKDKIREFLRQSGISRNEYKEIAKII